MTEKNEETNKDSITVVSSWLLSVIMAPLTIAREISHSLVDMEIEDIKNLRNKAVIFSCLFVVSDIVMMFLKDEFSLLNGNPPTLIKMLVTVMLWFSVDLLVDKKDTTSIASVSELFVDTNAEEDVEEEKEVEPLDIEELIRQSTPNEGPNLVVPEIDMSLDDMASSIIPTSINLNLDEELYGLGGNMPTRWGDNGDIFGNREGTMEPLFTGNSDHNKLRERMRNTEPFGDLYDRRTSLLDEDNSEDIDLGFEDISTRYKDKD